MTYKREQIEHSYTSLHRLRSQLQSLARLSALRLPHDRPEGVAREAVTELNARVCIFQRLNETTLETIGLHQQQEDAPDAERLKRIAARLGVEVIDGLKAIIINDLAARHPADRSFAEAGVASYLGVPMMSPCGAVIGAAAVMGGALREFSEEDEWWLQAAAQPVADALAHQALETKLKKLEEVLTPAANAPGGADDGAPKSNQLSVLVIDDDRTLNDVICEFLDLEGYQVEAAFDGLEAMRVFRPAEHDVVLADVAMPMMNGWELSAALRVRAPELPIVMITGYGSGNWNDSYLRKQGVVAVLNKPLELDRLLAILQSINTRLSE